MRRARVLGDPPMGGGELCLCGGGGVGGGCSAAAASLVVSASAYVLVRFLCALSRCVLRPNGGWDVQF